jgi:hypothetical protein
MSVARGVDRYFERYYAKGPRRRPVRIEFCEADVLDVFDEWRRAVGVSRAGEAGGDEGGEGRTRRRDSLPAHLERVVARLTALRSGEDRSLDEALEAVVREIDAARRRKSLRGGARDAFLDRCVLTPPCLSIRDRTDAATSMRSRTMQTRSWHRSAIACREACDQSRRACVDRLRAASGGADWCTVHGACGMPVQCACTCLAPFTVHMHSELVLDIRKPIAGMRNSPSLCASGAPFGERVRARIGGSAGVACAEPSTLSPIA